MLKKGGKNNYIYVFFLVLVIFIASLLLMSGNTIKEAFTTSASAPKVKIEYYYSDSCGHCVKFNESKIWDELEKSNFKNVSLHKYNINKMQARANKFNINSIPTIVAVDAASDTVINIFNEERTLDNLKKFISKY